MTRNFDSLVWNDEGGCIYHQHNSQYVIISYCRHDPGTPIKIGDIDRLKAMLEVMQREIEEKVA